MPEFNPFNIPRARRSARLAYERALIKAVRHVAKGSGWRSSEGMLFRDFEGWWTGVSPNVSILDDTTKVEVKLKPMSIDPLFWDICGMSENNNQPLSFRYLGAFTCPTPTVCELEIEEAGDPSDVAMRILDTACEQVDNLSALRDLPSYINFLKDLEDRFDTYRSTIVCSLIAMGCEREAVELCATAPPDSGKFLFLGAGPSSSFESMALDWLSRRPRSRVIN